MNEPSDVHGQDAQSHGTRLDSWKEIAAYLNRDIRTAQRWEKFEGLPVHRHRHDERGTAYAFSGEIERWLDARTRRSRTTAAGTQPLEGNGAAAANPRNRRSAILIGGIMMVTLGSAAFARWWNPATDAKLTTLSVVFPADERFPDWGPEIAFSPDGQTIAYQGRGLIKLRRLDQLDARTLPDPGSAVLTPFFSADGTSVGFFAPGKLFRVAGARPMEITSVDINFVGNADWGSNGEIVYATPAADGSHRLVRVLASGGRPSVIATLDGQRGTAYWLTPQWVDGGRHVLSTVARSSPSGATFQVVLVSATTGESRLLLDDARHGLLMDDVLVYWRDNALFAVRFDRDRLEPRGPHVTAWDNVGVRVRNRSWAASGDTLIYWPSIRSSSRLVWVDRDGVEESVALPPAEYRSPRLSPDGRRLLIIKNNGLSELGDVWQHDLATGANVRITHGNRSSAAAWTPDGAHLVVSMRQGGVTDLYRVRADGTGEPERLGSTGFLTGVLKQPAGWAGGQTLVVYQAEIKHEPAYWAVSLDGTAAPRPILNDLTVSAGGVSPDGQWLAYSSLASGRREVHVARLPEGQPTWQVSNDGGRFPVWSKTGRELFYRNGKGLMAVDVTVRGRSLMPGRPHQLLDRDVYEVEPGEPHYDVTREGRFLMLQRGRPDGPERLNVVQGWRTEVERRLRAAR
jgi:eukaryotic-like serine/threonine-protein kinase